MINALIYDSNCNDDDDDNLGSRSSGKESASKSLHDRD